METMQKCSCGCGKRAIKGAKWAKGHRPKPELKPCQCNCGTLVKGLWAHGHYARVHNPSSLDEVRKKRSSSAKRRIANGERTFAGWNRGLSVETDSRVAQYGQSISQTIQNTPGRTEQMSQNLKKLWDDGKWHRVTGSKTSAWKGGVSNIQQRCRATLYHRWSRPIMARDGFECQRCHGAKGGSLVVHHDGERFAAILQKIVNGRDVSVMSFEEQGELVDAIVDYHLTNGTSGVTLCRPCHDDVHGLDVDLDMD